MDVCACHVVCVQQQQLLTGGVLFDLSRRASRGHQHPSKAHLTQPLKLTAEEKERERTRKNKVFNNMAP